ncbi:MAG: polysaccharide deacetylase family protein, partial [Actinobacteria bacterium]|nr:polysaccharide deacetylase family protein [Actinomycetota bacterium]
MSSKRRHTRGQVAFLLLGALLGFALIGCSGGNPTTATFQTPARSTSTTVTQGPMTPARAKAIGANELGRIMVLMYHVIASPEVRYTRSPEHFREDIELLKANGYYPVNVRDLVDGTMEVPAGKSPVVITFDDSSSSQYRILADGSIDPHCALGILEDEVKKGGWARKATFHPLLEVNFADHIVFGQADKKREKLQNLVAWGYEVGSHTVTHLDLRTAERAGNVAEIKKQLYESETTLDTLIGNGYHVQTLAVPFGDYPKDDSFLGSGEYQGKAMTWYMSTMIRPSSLAP